MTDDGWRMADGGWRMADGGWRMADGGWRMSDVGCRMSDVGWRMTDGGWRMTAFGGRSSTNAEAQLESLESEVRIGPWAWRMGTVGWAWISVANNSREQWHMAGASVLRTLVSQLDMEIRENVRQLPLRFRATAIKITSGRLPAIIAVPRPLASSRRYEWIAAGNNCRSASTPTRSTS